MVPVLAPYKWTSARLAIFTLRSKQKKWIVGVYLEERAESKVYFNFFCSENLNKSRLSMTLVTRLGGIA